MFKLINLIICFILINNYGQSKKLSPDEFEFENKLQRATIDHQASRKYDFKESLEKKFSNFRTKSIDLDTSATANEVDIETENVPIYFENIETVNKQNQRFSKWFDIGEHSNQTSEQSSNMSESNLKNPSNNLIKTPTKTNKKKWRLISSSTLSDTSIDDNNEFVSNKNISLTTLKLSKKEQKRKSKKLKTANLDVKLKDSNDRDDYIKNRIANTTVYTFNRKDDLKFKLNDAIDYKNNYESNRIRSNGTAAIRSGTKYANDTFSRRTQLNGESSKISKKIMLATMLPSMIKGLTSSHTHVAVLPTAHIAQPVAQPIAVMPAVQPMPVHVPVPQIHIVAPPPPPPPPRPVYHHHYIARPQPAQIITQPIIHQPIIQQPVIQQQPVVHRRIITQPIIVSRPAVQVIRQQPQQVYQTLTVAAEPNCNTQVAQDDSNDEPIGDPVDDEDNSSVQDDGDAYSQNSWGQQEQQVRIVPQPVSQPPQDSWGNQPNVQNQKVYHYHTASVPKSTRTIYTQTKMIPSITSVHSTTSYTPEHKHMIVETDHNMKPVMNLVSTSHRKVISKPVYTVKAIAQPVMQTVQQQPAYISNNQGSWTK